MRLLFLLLIVICCISHASNTSEASATTDDLVTESTTDVPQEDSAFKLFRGVMLTQIILATINFVIFFGIFLFSQSDGEKSNFYHRMQGTLQATSVTASVTTILQVMYKKN